MEEIWWLKYCEIMGSSMYADRRREGEEGEDSLVLHRIYLHCRFLFTLSGGHISPILVAAKQLGIRVIDVC